MLDVKITRNSFFNMIFGAIFSRRSVLVYVGKGYTGVSEISQVIPRHNWTQKKYVCVCLCVFMYAFFWGEALVFIRFTKCFMISQKLRTALVCCVLAGMETGSGESGHGMETSGQVVKPVALLGSPPPCSSPLCWEIPREIETGGL